MNSLSAQLILPIRADLAEGPVWHPSTQRLHFVDITAGLIYTGAIGSNAPHRIDVGMMAGCVAPLPDGKLIAALANGIWHVDPDSGERTLLHTPRDHDPARCRFNDGKCDPQGRFWAGTMSLGGEAGAGALYRFSSPTNCHCILSNISVSNGLAWSRDGSTLYYIDSPTRQIAAFDFDQADGSIRKAGTAITLPQGNDLPDGCTLDEEGMLWVAHWGGGRVSRWDPKAGQHLATVSVPAPNVTSCTFGGAALDTLYITTARRGLSPAQLLEHPEAGGIFACRPGIRGLAAHLFQPSPPARSP